MPSSILGEGQQFQGITSAKYTQEHPSGMKEQIIEAFQEELSSLKVVFATIACGMGLDIPDIKQVIHVGPSADNEDYTQEIGRIGRNNFPSKAILMATYNRCASEMKAELDSVQEALHLQEIPKRRKY